MDRVRIDNTSQSAYLEKENEALATEDGTTEARRREVDTEVLNIRLNTERYEVSQQAYLDLLRSLAEPLLQVVKSVCPDDASIEDSSILSGINNHNMEPALGVLEGRVDDLFQFSRAAMDEDVGLDELCKPPEPEVDVHGRVPALRAPVLEVATSELVSVYTTTIRLSLL